MKKIMLAFIAILPSLVILHTAAAARISHNAKDQFTTNLANCTNSTKTTFAPAVPSAKFASIYGDNDIAITSFVAKCSRLKETYIWLHEESAGLIAAQIAQGGPYGQVIAVGSVAGTGIGKHRVEF